MTDLGINKDQLQALASTTMPFGKYKGRLILDLPEEYLLWMQQKGFANNTLGHLLALTLELKIQGIDDVLTPLKQSPATHSGSDQMQ